MEQQMETIESGPSVKVRDMETAKKKTHTFWNSQPVPKFDENADSNGPIDENITVESARREQHSLPKGFEWRDIDISDEAQLDELHTLLSEHYVESCDNMFRLDYSKSFIQWVLFAPGWLQQYHCGVRLTSTQKLVAFISAVPQTIRVHEADRKMVEINFLCIHNQYRSKHMAPLLISEIARRAQLQGIFQAAYTAGVILPKPVAQCKYYYRNLNPKNLIESGFCRFDSNTSLSETIEHYKLPNAVSTPGLRPMKKKDINGAWHLLQSHLTKFKLTPSFTEKEFEHYFLPREDIIYAFVVENDGKISDMISFYSIPSTVVNNPLHNQIRAAYGYYCVSGSAPLKQIMNDMLIIAQQLGFDVFNIIDIMDNMEIMDELKFGLGDARLQYYLYNWRCPEMQPSEVGLILQ